MKKVLVLSFAALAILVACNKKTAPGSGMTMKTGNKQGSSKESKSGETATTNKSDEEQKAIDAMAAAEKKTDETTTPTTPTNTPDVPNKPSEDESGKIVFNKKCTTCHGAKSVGAYTFNQWEGILKSMVPKAKLSADEETQLYAYIRAHAK